MNIAAIILAAGASRRMGSPKQLLPYAGSTLLQHALDETLAVFGDRTFLVLGANADQIRQTMGPALARVIINQDWESGMASSVKAGLTTVLSIYPDDLDAVIFLTGDQPYLTGTHLRHLVETCKTHGADIAASSYDGITGVPAIFKKRIFPDLLNLTADTGARYIIQQHQKEVVTVSFPEGSIDIDTPEQYQQLLNNQQ